MLLDTINNPDDLKKLSLDELPSLAQEIRDTIVKIVADSGGHLASSLGAVELIIGIHYILNAPQDKIIWDVGHQAYAHKLLTGRRDRFHTLRKIDGLSGFPNKYESEFDVFTTGHGSTSISCALGMVAARDLEAEDYRVVAVIGDASLGGGMAFEALNHAGHIRKKILVILNDNEMSISKSVGALSKYLNRILTAPIYNKVRKDIENLLKRVPRFGFRVIRSAKRLEEGLKNLLVPGMLFEELGFRYFGPIDGNDIRTVVGTLRNIIDMNEPVLLHVVTKKGKGYPHAEKIPEKFHGVSSFDISTGEKLYVRDEKTTEKATSFTEVFSEVIIDVAGTDEKVVAITAAMPEGTGLDKFSRAFPDRFFDVGMAEQHAVGFAAGLARAGLKPVVAIYSTFLQRSYDQIIHDVCLQNLNVIFMLDRAGLVGEDGLTHHGLFDIAYLRNIPQIVAMAPKDEIELKEMFKFAVSYNKGPVAIRYPRGGSYSLPSHQRIEVRGRDIELGKAEILKEGKDVTIVGIGYMSYVLLDVAALLLDEGIDCEVINARFIKPLDMELILGSILKTEKLFTVEEGVVNGGFGSSILEAIVGKVPQDIIIKNIGLPDRFIEHGDRDILLDRCGLSVQKIKETIISYAKNRDRQRKM
ncbi:MAG: 1-deoxy-D-xylulose-5-phosphate synthase [Candidatus Omnitrophica bacterium]|nr:1-deoxy-D-xylulose-5-phosphate synthase [Candidatus Omnitrophota bacterium]